MKGNKVRKMIKKVKKMPKLINVALFNKDVAPEKIPKINKRTPTFIPESRVIRNLIFRVRIWILELCLLPKRAAS